MILVLRQSHHGSTKFAPAMQDNSHVLPRLSLVVGKPVHAAFDASRLPSDAGILVLAEIERRPDIAERLAGCLSDPRDPDWRFGSRNAKNP
jgi:hypothetical protein